MRFILLILMISSIKCNAQTVDSDGDGLIDTIEEKVLPKSSMINFNPYVSDMPNINIWFTGEIQIGIEFQDKFDSKYSNRITSTFSNEQGEISKEKNYNSTKFSNSTISRIKGSYATIKSVFTPNLSIDLSNTTSYDVSNGMSYSNEKWDSWKKQNTKNVEELNSKSLSYGPSDGYISTSIYLFNPLKHDVTISNIVFNILVVDPNSNKILSLIPFDILHVVKFIDNGFSSTSKNLHEGLNGPYKVIISKINTNRIQELITSNKSVAFKLERNDYDISLGKITNNGTQITTAPITRKAQIEEIERKCFKLRIMNDNSDKTYSIAYKDKEGASMSIKKALANIGAKVDYGIALNTLREEVPVIKSMDNLYSELRLNTNPKFYERADYEKGHWLITFITKDNTPNFMGGVNEEIVDEDIEIILYYLKGRDLVSQEKKYTLVYSSENVSSYETSMINLSGYYPVIDDSIVLTVIPKYEKFNTKILTKDLCSCGSYLNKYPFQDYYATLENFHRKNLFDYRILKNNASYNFLFLSQNSTFNDFGKSFYSFINDISDGEDLKVIFSNENILDPVYISTGYISQHDIQCKEDNDHGQSRLNCLDSLRANVLTPKIVYPKMHFDCQVNVYRRIMNEE